jgi:hypothetical protein
MVFSIYVNIISKNNTKYPRLATKNTRGVMSPLEGGEGIQGVNN